MKSVRKLIILLIVISTLISLISCNKAENPAPQKRIFYEYFDTVGTFYDYTGMPKEKFNSLADRVEGLLSQYHKLYDIYNEYEGLENLATINKSAGDEAVSVDQKIVDLLLYSKEVYSLTNGKLNVAMGSVLKIWHKYRDEGVKIPEMDELSIANANTDINNLIIDEKNCTVALLDPKMSLDVGAIAKGYAVEMTARFLENEGYSGLVLDVGGNLRVIGKKPNGDGWSAGVKNPSSPYSQTYVYKTTLKNEALVTSGSYERFYTVDGVRYHHIINGETLMPENYYLSVSVKSSSSALSDALTTAIFNMKYEEACDFVKTLDEIFVVLVMPNGEVRTLGKE